MKPLPETLDRIAELAAKATPGPWYRSRRNPQDEILGDNHMVGDTIVVTAVASIYRNDTSEVISGQNADYIAALDPATVLRLVAVARAAVAWTDSWDVDGPEPASCNEHDLALIRAIRGTP